MRKPEATLVAIALALFVSTAFGEDAPAPQTVQSAYPGLLAGVLASAAIGELEAGILLDMREACVTQQQLNEVLLGAPEKMREQLTKNSLLLVQEMATEKLLVQAAREWAEKREAYPADRAEPQAVSDYLQDLVSDVAVSDAEVREFYEENRGMFSGAEFADVRDTLRQFVLKTKRQERVDEHVRSLGGRFGVVISGPWLVEQAVALRDNPVDKARGSGRPTIADFGADGCKPCEMMAPILEELKQSYAGRANVVFVHVREEPVLASRYGVRAIPLQVFFDKNGMEVYRHTGFYSRQEIQAKLAEMGAE